MSAPATQSNRWGPGADGRRALVALLLVQLLVGYEWFISGLTKIVRGGFPSGLAKELTEKSVGAPGWYKGFLDGSVIPNASAFGYLIEICELVVGLALIAAALLWLLRWERLPDAAVSPSSRRRSSPCSQASSWPPTSISRTAHRIPG